MAKMAERKDPRAALITLSVASVLACWGLYGLQGLKLDMPIALPCVDIALKVIAAILALRGLVILWALSPLNVPNRWFWVWSSLICLVLALSYGLLFSARDYWG